MERGKRIELSALAWKAKVLPLYEPRILTLLIGALGELSQGTNYIVTGTLLQYLHRDTSMSCYLVLHYTKLWCG